jgi:ATP-dependent Clp protease ATP-binding subunit ClpA
VSEAAVDDAIKSIRVKQMGRDNVGKGKAASGGSSVDEDTSSLLTKYTIDLTELACQDNFEPFVGREPETRRIMTILTRRRGNSVLLLGEHGAGKTALISCLASRISNRTAPPSLLSAKLLSLDIPLLTSASEVEIRQNILAICQAVASSPNSILVIDDIELLLPGCANTASIVCPLLSTPSDPLRIIATTTPSFHEAIISSSPLSSALQHLPIPPLTTNTTTSMLLALKSNYEIYHGVNISYDAILACATSPRSRNDQEPKHESILPADAIHLLDAAASSSALTRELGSQSTKCSRTANLRWTLTSPSYPAPILIPQPKTAPKRNSPRSAHHSKTDSMPCSRRATSRLK